MFNKLNSRVRACLLHFFISLLIFTAIFLILINLWYPEPYFKVSGGWQGLRIAAPVDLILGPLLTLIVFNPLKSLKELKSDLSIIGIVQISALIWGIHTIYEQRPVALVFWENSFLTVAATELTEHNYPLEKLAELGRDHPVMIFAEKPRDKDGLNRLLENLEKHNIAPHHQTEWYRPLLPNFPAILNFQIALSDKFKQNPVIQTQMKNLEIQSGINKANFRYFFMQAKYKDMVVVFSSEGKLVGYLIQDS